MHELGFLKAAMDDIHKRGVYNKVPILQGQQLPTSVIDGKEVVNLSSNNYLGLATHPKICEASIAATKKYGGKKT